MRTTHEDKAIGLEGSKLSPAAQRAYERRTIDLELSGDEQNEIGRQVALANERKAQPKWWPGMQQAAAPSAEEATALAAALLAYDVALAKREAARAVGFAAEREVHTALQSGGSYSTPDPVAASRLARGQAAVTEAEYELDRLTLEVDFAAGAVGRARGAINSGGQRRQRIYVAGL